MATVTFIKYAKQSAGALGGVAGYVAQAAKTVQEDGQQLISGQNCNLRLACQEFLATRAMHHKNSPVYFYHYVQSFAKDEPVTGKLAHEVATEFAARAWPESEVLIATHTDREHIHSHFIINSVCFDSGQMLRQGPSTLARLRPISDELCMAHGLSVLPTQQEKKAQGMSAREYRTAAKGQSWKFRLMNAIDECMLYARSREEFIALMNSGGYSVRWEAARKSITYTIPGGMKCRDDRLHDEKYSKGAMEHEFRIRQRLVLGGIEAVEYTGAYEVGAASSADGNKPRGAADRPLYDAAENADAVGAHPEQHPDAAANHFAIAAGAGDEGGPDAVGVERRSARLDEPDGGGQSGADRGRQTGSVGDEGAVLTGWEDARQVFELSLRGGTDVLQRGNRTGEQAPDEDLSDDPVLGGDFHSHQRSDLSASDPVDLTAPLGVAASVVQLGHALERASDDGPAKDAATRREPSHDRRRKLAPGQKEDDHEDEYNWQQTMY